MTHQEMESTVANLLLEQGRLKRLGTNLPPDKLSLLNRLLYRLGYSKMSCTNPKRYSDDITNYSAEHTEDNFQNYLDDHTARQIFADWLDDRGDPRAEGYRALGQLQKRSYQSIHNPKDTWVWHDDKFNRFNADYANGSLPTSWLKAVKNNHPQYGNRLDSSEYWKYGIPRRKADDAAALAFGKLPNHVKNKILAPTHRSRVKYTRLTLSQPKPGVSFGGEPLNEHNLHDEQGNVVGNIKVRDRGPMLHVDWIGGKGLKAGPNGLGNEAMRSIHDAIATHYPNAQYLTGHRISGFRGKQTTGERVVIPIRRRVKMSRINPKRYVRGDTVHGWLSPTGKFHPLNAEHGTDSHDSAIKRHGYQEWDDAFNDGWVRVVNNGPSLFAHNPHQRLTWKQKSELKDLAITSGLNELRYLSDDGGEGGLLWSNSDHYSRKPIRYAKFNKETKAHPLVAGFPIEHALRHIANHPESTSEAKDLAVAALRGHTEALWGLNDALQESDHPINKAGYKWLNAADKLHLDKHTYTALEESAANVRAEQPHTPHRMEDGQHYWNFTPEHQAIRAANGITSHPMSLNGLVYQNLIDRVKELSPNSTDEDIKESIRRHGHRAAQEASRRTIGSSADEGPMTRALKHPIEDKKPDAYSHKNEMASRYKRKPESIDHKKLTAVGKFLSQNGAMPGYGQIFLKGSEVWYVGGDGDNWPEKGNYPEKKFKEVPGVKKVIYEAEAFPKQNDGWIRVSNGSLRDDGKKLPRKYSLANKSNFIGSLLKASSPEHKMFVQRTKQLARQAGAKQTKEFPALHDTPQQSVPGVALAVYGHIQPDNAHALGSWVNGLLPNSPGYAVFHARPTGPDTLYRIRMEGSGHDARAKLDRSGISSRVFVPHRKGLDVLIPDKGSQMGQLVQNFAAQQKVPVESSQGHITTVGSQDQAQARDTFRNKVVTAENKMSRNPRRVAFKQYAVKVYKPPGGKYNPLKKPTPSPREFQYEPGLLPPTDRAKPKELPEGSVTTLPKDVKQKESNPTVVPPKEKPLFSTAEYNRLHAWAHKHAFTHTPTFAKFLGKRPRDPEVYNQLVNSIIEAAHDMGRSGNNSYTNNIGDTGKRIKINIPRTSWINVKTQGKTVKLKPKTERLSRYSRRRLSLNTYNINLDYSLGA